MTLTDLLVLHIKEIGYGISPCDEGLDISKPPGQCPFARVMTIHKTIVIFTLMFDDGGVYLRSGIEINAHDPNSFDKVSSELKQRFFNVWGGNGN